MPRFNMASVAGYVRRTVPVGLGLLLGIVIVLTSTHRDTPMWPVWASLAVALSIAAGAVFSYGLDRWTELAGPHKLQRSDVALPVAAIAALSLVMLLVATLLTGRSSWRSTVLAVTALLGGIPAAGVMYGIRRAARDQAARAVINGEQVALLLTLRQLLQRVLAAVGSLVALSTLALAAGLKLWRSLPAGSELGAVTGLPPEVVPIFGGAGSLLVALLYVPAITALRDCGQGLCDELFQLDDKVKEGSAILSLAENRHQLEQLLGIDRGIFTELQAGLVILGPLLASAAATFLSP
jgi:hypothetical protein